MPEFETKDSGERIKFSTGMQRDTNKTKPRFDLIMPKGLPFDQQMLTRWAKLMQRGAEKYNARNWEKASTQEEYERFMDSAFRHFLQWLCGETDEDHAAAVFFNITGAEYVKWGMKCEHRKYPLRPCDCYKGPDPKDVKDVFEDVLNPEIFTEFENNQFPRT